MQQGSGRIVLLGQDAVPFAVIEASGAVIMGPAYEYPSYWTGDRTCAKTAQDPANALGGESSLLSWVLRSAVIRSDAELNRFIKETFGEECVYVRQPFAHQSGIWLIELDDTETVTDDTFCFGIMSRKAIFYSPERQRVVYWDMHQDASFAQNADLDNPYTFDIPMLESVRFQ